MDKKSKEALRRYKKARAAQSSSDSSSSSDSDSGSSSGSYSSSSSEKKPGHRKKKARDSSSSGDERRKRDKGHSSCHQKKLEAKRNHLKRKLREAKAAKKRALGTNAVRRASPGKVKVPGEKKHVRTDSKERLRHAAEREKMRARERERIRSRSPRTLAKLEAKMRARKSPVAAVSRHQLSPREKIIIQTRTRERTPERKRDLKMRLDDSRERERRDRERAEREAERQKEREEALARCQERQRERERLAREKLRREKEKEYAERGGERLIPRPAEREMALAQARGYGSRERSLEDEGRLRHSHASRIRDPAYEREREYLAAEHHRVPVLERDERREREYLVIRRREVLSPGHYRDERDLYSEEERAAYARAYAEEERRRDPRWDPRELELLNDRELEKLYPPVRRGEDWPEDDRWDEKNWGRSKSNRPPSEPDWDAEEFAGGSRQLWEEAREKRERERALDHVQSPSSGRSGRWPQQDWARGHPQAGESGSSHRKGANYRHSGAPLDYMHDRQKFRPHPPPLMAIHSGYHPPTRQFPSKRQMTYTNPNLKKKLGGPPTTPGGTAIPSLLALPPIPPPSISELVAAEKEQQPLMMEINEPIPTMILPSVIPEEEPKNVEEVEKPEPEVKVTPIEQANEEVKDPEVKVEEQALPETPSETEPVPVKENESSSEATPTTEAVEEQAPIDAPTDVAAAPAVPTEENPVETEPVPDDLSEISDSDDEILDKLEESKPAIDPSSAEANGDVPSENPITGSPMKDAGNEDSKPEVMDDDLLDFEEISDGELEEDSRTKGVGDALGVDWASLVKEAKVPALHGAERTTAKEKWQAHRIILDVGISLKMAGEEFGKRILTEAKEKLNAELGETKPIKMEIKEEMTEEAAASEESGDDKNKIKIESKMEGTGGETFDVNRINPLACAQVGERVKLAAKQSLIIGACGPNSRALSARYDLKLRRKLCGLPTLECDFRRPASEKMKSIALALFQRTMEVK
ncbi:fl(2)d-associated complex component [Episyrphus balteatus]|uniref:fl(2)d-associated complex component n=1 Tax=Episyrphus balteatus TaxID=286459 RepID=UPI0024863603|nr:fl(2)d-associated complex component [Episyrphus balteatus]